MSRPSKDTDEKLLKAARALIGEAGISGLTLRAVADKAGVNLGMFHYHFGNKEKFIQRLLQDIYEEFFGRLSLESQAGSGAINRLRGALLVFGKFSRDNRKLFVALMTEALQGDKNCLRFLQANIPRHIRVVSGLIEEGQREGELKKIPITIAVAFALGGMGSPNLVASAMERFGARFPLGKQAVKSTGDFLSDQAIELRADLILSGLAARPPRKRDS
jgi:AcrR family transcriptional regulator